MGKVGKGMMNRASLLSLRISPMLKGFGLDLEEENGSLHFPPPHFLHNLFVKQTRDFVSPNHPGFPFPRNPPIQTRPKTSVVVACYRNMLLLCDCNYASVLEFIIFPPLSFHLFANLPPGFEVLKHVAV